MAVYFLMTMPETLVMQSLYEAQNILYKSMWTQTLLATQAQLHVTLHVSKYRS